jgi:hypothetical protein
VNLRGPEKFWVKNLVGEGREGEHMGWPGDIWRTGTTVPSIPFTAKTNTYQLSALGERERERKTNVDSNRKLRKLLIFFYTWGIRKKIIRVRFFGTIITNLYGVGQFYMVPSNTLTPTQRLYFIISYYFLDIWPPLAKT